MKSLKIKSQFILLTSIFFKTKKPLALLFLFLLTSPIFFAQDKTQNENQPLLIGVTIGTNIPFHDIYPREEFSPFER